MTFEQITFRGVRPLLLIVKPVRTELSRELFLLSHFAGAIMFRERCGKGAVRRELPFLSPGARPALCLDFISCLSGTFYHALSLYTYVSCHVLILLESHSLKKVFFFLIRNSLPYIILPYSLPFILKFAKDLLVHTISASHLPLFVPFYIDMNPHPSTKNSFGSSH